MTRAVPANEAALVDSLLVITPTRTLLSLLCCTMLLTGAARAQGTHLWNESSPADWEKGTPHGVAIANDGTLSPGYDLAQVAQLNAADVWAAVSDKSGNAYIATGSPAQVVRVAPDGKQTVLFTTKNLSVQSLAVGPDGAVYAAVLPSAKVYRLAPDAVTDETKAEVVFDPADTAAKPRYVWAMQFDRAGRLLLGTGAPGAVYRVSLGSGKPELLYQSDEPHIRSLLQAPDGSLLAGSDGTGLVYRIDPAGKTQVLFEAQKREITALALGSTGQLYIAAVGEKGRASGIAPLPVGGTPGVVNAQVTVTVVQPGSTQSVSNNATVPDGSEVYLIPANGSEAPRRIWATHDEVVYALKAIPAGLLAATGNHGRVYRVHDDGSVEDVAHGDAGQVIGFADAPGGVYLPTANTGKLLRMGLTPAGSGTLTSDVFDATEPSLWGRAEVTGTNYDLETRTGNIDNPVRGWSDWKRLQPGDPAGAPGTRFAQWRLTLHPGANVTQIGLNYLPANAAPVVDEILVAPGTRVNAAANQPSIPQQTTLTFASQGGNAINIDSNSPQAPLTAIRDKAGVTARWAAHDDNGDDLRFSLYYRSADEGSWMLLKDNLSDRYYSFDAALLPDGPYRLRVVVTDAPSHPPGAALTGERVSDQFLIATATPQVSALAAKRDGANLRVTVMANDIRTPISRAEYSLDAAPWQYVEPVGRMSDSLREQYEFTIPAGPGPHVLTLRAFDRFDNVGSAKISVP